MAKEICISSTPHETRLAILEDDQLAEIYYERENEYTLASSIYNGRVTRVLPGMQSAFVDIGLERDAFLYVTDFMELEDPEETDEIEKAAASGANQPPREVRHTAPEARSDGRNGRSGQKPESKPEQKPEPKPEARQSQRPPAEMPRALTVEELPQTEAAALPASGSISFSEPADSDQDSTEAGAKRWRGRRRRRGNRGSAQNEGQAQPAQTQVSQVDEIEEDEQEVAPQIHAGAGDRPSPQKREATEQAHHFDRIPASAPVPVPFVMPGESLSKYGGAPVEGTAKPSTQATAPARPASSFKPATLIDSPLQWDGSGLLPGESLSRHRNRPVEPVAQEAVEVAEEQPSETLSAAPEASGFTTEEEEFFEETIEAGLDQVEAEEELAPSPEILEKELVSKWTKASLAEDDLDVEVTLEEDEFEETSETVAEPLQQTIDAPEVDAPGLDSETKDAEIEGTDVAEPDASASHDIDPLPPAGFNLFGFGKKKAEEAPKPPAKPVSSYAPGKGLVVEETIEEEEFDAPRHAHRAKGGDHDSDAFEEETLPKHLRTGDLGEMLQEAHLDHRIQLNFDGDTDEEDEDEPATSGSVQPAAAGQQRRDRNLRGGRQGRPGQGAPQQGNRGRGGPTRRSSQLSDLPIISDLLKPGQEILVQIAKEPIAKKGARITSHIALPGRFLVFMPTVTHIGVSRKIASDEERQRLKRILVHERGEASGGFIVRTAAEGASEEELRSDLRMLLNLWAEIKKRSDESKSPALIYHDLGLIERILRDQVSSNFSSIWVDSQENYERIVRLLNRFSPSLVRRVKLYTKETPLFEQFGIQDEIAKALNSKVWLKSGGSIVINQTEALVAIDINTGKYVGKSARLEDTIVKT
ncbi:MAG: ribonuclease E/G, partial [Terracidiphilus sp.]